MEPTTIQGRWHIVRGENGTVRGRHTRSNTTWDIKPDPNRDGVRLTVFPDATTYGWLVFRTEKEALQFALGRSDFLSDDLFTKQMARWLKRHASSS